MATARTTRTIPAHVAAKAAAREKASNKTARGEKLTTIRSKRFKNMTRPEKDEILLLMAKMLGLLDDTETVE